MKNKRIGSRKQREDADDDKHKITQPHRHGSVMDYGGVPCPVAGFQRKNVKATTKFVFLSVTTVATTSLLTLIVFQAQTLIFEA